MTSVKLPVRRPLMSDAALVSRVVGNQFMQAGDYLADVSRAEVISRHLGMSSSTLTPEASEAIKKIRKTILMTGHASHQYAQQAIAKRTQNMQAH